MSIRSALPRFASSGVDSRMLKTEPDLIVSAFTPRFALYYNVSTDLYAA
jgi:hypothetical protein